MTLALSKIHAALLAAGVPDDKAMAAAVEVAEQQRREPWSSRISPVWAVIIGIAMVVGAGVIMGVLLSMLPLWLPNKFDDATLVAICRDGTPILRKQDGTIWARRSAIFAYRVEDEKTVCRP